ncbi:MAG: metallophosphoesterase family protein [Verrucomicrobia bacterium]|nr:metallophosphoesterase family protein [Verrucomicrobiota bacterium]
MQIAVLADIHGNLPALLAVLDDLATVAPDLVIAAGDFQNRGPQPREVTELLFSRGWPMLRGNHEDYVLHQSAGMEVLDIADHYNWLPARWTASVTRCRLDAIRALPIALALKGPNGDSVVVAHGSPRSNAEGFFPSTSDRAAREMCGEPPPAVLCCGHTHFPLIRRVDSTLVFNVGSVGFPFDGDQRAAYGVLCFRNGKWHADLRRVPYPVDQVIGFFRKDGFYDNVGPLGHIIRRELESARPHLTAFYQLFGPLLRDRRLTIFQAVDAYLEMSQTAIEEEYLKMRRKRS